MAQVFFFVCFVFVFCFLLAVNKSRLWPFAAVRVHCRALCEFAIDKGRPVGVVLHKERI